MPRRQPFKFKTAEELLRKAESLNLDLPFSESLEPLFQPFAIGGKTLPNHLAVQPMEGCDGNVDGSPGELTQRRYLRYARGGSGLIWFEATAIVPEGRSNPQQLLLNRDTLDSFKRLTELVRAAARQAETVAPETFFVLQLTHSGRFSQPAGKAVSRNPHLEAPGEEIALYTDHELDRYADSFVSAAALAKEAGFDAVDIKACHGYLLGELLAARTRSENRYGGSLENRMRLLLNIVRRIRADILDIVPAVRISAYDAIPYPYGFGVAEDGFTEPDLAEPKILLRRLQEAGCGLVNITAGIPRIAPHVSRPFDQPAPGAEAPGEHPLQGVARLINIAAELQSEVPEIPLVGTGYSYLRNYWPYIAAGVLEKGGASLVGLGRSSFAYPDAPRDLMESGSLSPRKCCITCSRCSELMKRGINTGCVVRDKKIYGELYKKFVAEVPD